MDYRLEQLRFELREDPTSRIFFKLGEHLRREGEIDEAIEVLSNGLSQHPRYVAAWVSLGRALHDNGDAADAVVAFSKALELDPENGVAARSAGEAAIANGDWIEAVKNLKRARGIMPQDDALDERIVFVEERLDELGMLEVKAPDTSVEATPAHVPAEDPEAEDIFIVDEAGGAAPEESANDVFETTWDESGSAADEVVIEEPEIFAETPGSVDEIEAEGEEPLILSEETDFEIVSDDSSEDAVFDTSSMEVEELQSEPSEVEILQETAGDVLSPAVEEVIPEPEILDEPVLEVEPLLEVEPVPVFEPEAQGAVEDEDAMQAPVGENRAEISDDVPMPTLTLARLAMEQGDFALAERTARAVLERDPGQAEAMALLDTFAARNGADTGSGDDPAGADERTRALQRWLEAVRLAAEKLES